MNVNSLLSVVEGGKRFQIDMVETGLSRAVARRGSIPYVPVVHKPKPMQPII
jgi:hypothetical protein